MLSYGLYLWHWPVYVVLSPDRMGFGGVPLLGVRILVSLAFAYVSYRLIEGPVRHRATWARGRSGVVVLVAVLVGVVLLLRALPDPTGQVAEFDPSAIAATVAAVPPDPASPAASTELSSPPDDVVLPLTPSRAERRSPPNPPRRWLRPSHMSRRSCGRGLVAFDIAPALRTALTSGGWVVDDSAAYPGFMLTTRDEKFDLVAHTVNEATVSGAELAILQISNWDV